jgi:hypothetical protein
LIGMSRSLPFILLSFLLATGCASTARLHVASSQPTQAAKELECMGECLEDPEANCDDCAVRCFAPPTGVLLSLQR